MTYEKLIYNIPAYQEGNLQDFQFTMDSEFPMESVSAITLQVRDEYNKTVILEKTSVDESNPIIFDTDTREVSIVFVPEDTIGKAGVHLYEIDFVDENNMPFATIGGKFTINAQINTL